MSDTNQMKKLLYVENDRSSLLLIVHLLSRKYEIDTAENAETALSKIMNNNYDLILMDVKLEHFGKSGQDVLNEIRRIPNKKDIPVIAVTSYAMAGDRERLLHDGFDAYVAKPIDFQTLKTAISYHLEHSKHNLSQKSDFIENTSFKVSKF